VITVSLPEEIETRLKDVASRIGVSPDQYIRELIVEHLPTRKVLTPEELFAQWEAEDPITGPEDIAQRTREADELTEALNRNRRESEGPGARTPFP